MGQNQLAVIHCEPRISWQPRRAAFFAEGFARRGIPYVITPERVRLNEGFPVLLGTTCWRVIERDGGDFLLVDRCSFGDTERFVSLVWNGHGRRGDHRVPPGYDASRWEKHGVELKPITPGPSQRTVLCGQTELYTSRYATLEDWYAAVPATHFRKHPAGGNPTRLPDAGSFRSSDVAVTLNSSIGVQAVLDGIPTVVMDDGSMAYDVAAHRLEDVDFMGEREPWAHWLAWTQWTDDEIKEGAPWDYLL